MSIFPAAMARTPGDWQLTAGDFATVSAVSSHNMIGQGRAEILATLSADPTNWAEALTVYTFSRNFPWKGMTHSLGRFAEDYNGAMPDVLPA